MNKLFYDDYFFVSKNLNELFTQLKERENATQRYKVRASEITFSEAAILPSVEGISDPEIYTDTVNHTNLMCNFKGKTYMVGESTKLSLTARSKIYGNGFDILPAEMRANVLNWLFKNSALANSWVTIICVNDKVRAMMSAQYKAVDIPLIYDRVINLLTDKLDATSYHLKKGTLDHYATYSHIEFEVPQKFKQSYGNFIPGVCIGSSDTGHKAVEIVPYLSNGSLKFFLSEDYYTRKHIGTLDIADIEKSVTNSFTAYQDIAQKLMSLMVYNVSDPKKVFKKCVSKEAGLKFTQKGIEALTNEFNNMLFNKAGGAVTAFDIYKVLIMYPTVVNASNSTFKMYEAQAAKAINLPYRDYDR